MPAATAPVLESERLRLRPWRADDVHAFAAIVGDHEVMRLMGSGPRYAIKRAAARLVARVSDVEARRSIAEVERHWERYGYGEWAVEERAGGGLVGKIGLRHHADFTADRADVEVGWTLARHAWGRGYATEGGRLALDHAFVELGAERVISIARHDNERSLRVMERLGLRLQGSARWHGSDVVWYALDRRDWRVAHDAAA